MTVGRASSLLVPFVLLAYASAQGRTYRLNDPFPLVPGADVRSIEISADGAWIVYVADGVTDDVEQLYSVPFDGSDVPHAIAGEDGGSGVFSLTIIPDGTRVLYSTTPAVLREVRSVPIDGSAPALQLVDAHVRELQVTSDSSRVVFRGDVLAADRFMLFSVPVDGSAAPSVLSGPITGGGDVVEFEVSPDGTRAVYRADAFVDGQDELFSVAVDASAPPLRLNPPLAVGRDVFDFHISPDGTRVVYRADQTSASVSELYTVPIDGSAAAVQLNTPLAPGGGQDVEADFVPSGARVVYRADETSNDVVQLFSVPIDASAPPQLLTPGPGGDVEPGPVPSPDGTRVVFRGDLLTDGVVELFSVPIDGSGSAVRLNGALAAGEDVLAELVIAPNGSRVAFLSGAGSSTTLFSVPLDASAAPLALDSDPQYLFSDLTIGANSARVLYRKPDFHGSHLWSARLDGSSAAFALSVGEDLGNYRLTPSGAGVLYVADEDIRAVAELFVRPASGSIPSFQINPEFPDNVVDGSVRGYVIAGSRALYVADPDESNLRRGLYSVPISRRTPPILISASSGSPIDVEPSGHQSGAGGTRAVFLGFTDGIQGIRRELFSAAVDGSSEPVRLNAPLAAGGNVTVFGLSGDGTRVVYLADQDTDEVFELYRAEIDGSGGPVKLSGTLVPGGDVFAASASGDGSHVVFVADRDTDGVSELYSSDGISAPIKLSPPILVQFGSVQTDPVLSADGAWVFFRADAIVNDLMELYRAPIDGSSGSVKLSGTGLGSVGVEGGFRVTPDSSRVLFRAHALASGNTDLFTVPADGSAAPLRLNSVAGAWYSAVSEVELDSSGTLAVFRYDPDNDRLYSVPVDGSAPDVQLTPLVGNQFVVEDEWRISPDGARVVYKLYTVSCCTDLLSVPIDGSAPPTVLTPSPEPPVGFLIDPAGERVAFVGYPASALFLVPIDGSAAPAELFPSSVNSGNLEFTTDGAALLFSHLADGNSFSVDLRVAPFGKVRRRGTSPDPTFR